MSRKFDRQYQIQQKVVEVMSDPGFMNAIFRPRPRWFPKFLWRMLVGLVVRK
jgi:hypothetical protein